MELYRVDYTLVGLTNPNCVKLLPSTGFKLSQKVAVGDKEGVTTIFFIKKGEVEVIFKSLPGLPVTNVVLGGSIGTIQDKVFVSNGNEVHGYTKKGKMFLHFETQLLEDIKIMYVSGSDLLICGIYVYHHYLDCKLLDTYVTSDTINDMIPLNTLKVRRLITVLACNDQTLRVLDGSTVVQTHIFDDNPTKLQLSNGDGGPNGDLVLVATKEGHIYLIHISRSGSIPILWIIENEKHKSQITCITCFDLLKVGQPDIIIGRQDGNVEVYSNVQTDETDGCKPPVLKFKYSCNESVISVQAGYIGNINFEEIAVTTYTGWFFGLTTEIPEKSISINEHLEHNYGISKDEKQKIIKLRADIEEIETKVTKEREKYLAMTQDDSLAISRLPLLTISDKMSLNKEDASYTITLEMETNIDNVLVQCDVPVKFLDVDKNSAVVSYSKCEQSSGNAMLATYRCQLNTTRLELKFFSAEGQRGTLLTYVTPLTQPKCCQVRTFPIKPLLLHFRNHNIAPVESPVNALRLKGTFSLAEMHSWISQCLPEIPEKLPNEDKVEYLFESVLMATVLKCSYERGDAEFKSNNISTISILKDVITKEATKKKIRLDISSATDGETILSTLRILDANLDKYCRLERQMKILEALKDIDTAQAEPLSGYLTADYKAILDNEQEILLQAKQNPFYLERLHNSVIDMFVDWHKYKGLSVKPKLSLFIDTLKQRYSFEEICSYFTY